MSLFVSTGRTSESMTSMLVRCLSRDGRSMAPETKQAKAGSVSTPVRLPERYIAAAMPADLRWQPPRLKSSKGWHGATPTSPAVALRAGTHARARAARRSTSRWRGAEASCRKCSALARPLRLSLSVPVGCARPHYCTRAHKHTRTRTARRPFTIGRGGTMAHSHLARDAVSCNVVL